MNRIKKLSMEVLENHKDEFGIDFQANKKNLEQISIIRSKGLKNEIAGYITKFLKHEMLDKKKQEERIANQSKIGEESPEENLDMVEPKVESETSTEATTPETSTEATTTEETTEATTTEETTKEITEENSEN